jgi:hypothetical protein
MNQSFDLGLFFLKAVLLVCYACPAVVVIHYALDYYLPDLFVRPLMECALWGIAAWYGASLLLPKLWWWVRAPLVPFTATAVAVGLYTFRPGSPYVAPSDLLFLFETLLSWA